MCKRNFVRLSALLLTVVTALIPVRVCAEETQAVAASVSASAAVLYEPLSGRVLFEQNAHEKRPMASTTKLMTALLATELLSADEDIVVSAQAVAVEGTCMGLRVDDRISRHDLLCGLLLESGNDAANAIALAACGSYEAFAEKMNARAAALGMTHSVFVTPSGLDEGEHGASAYDMALLAAAVLENEELAAICATKQTTVSFGNPKREVTLSNHNRLLSLYPDTIGMKTGYTSAAGRCLVSAAQRDGVTLIAVTLNCPDDWNEHAALYDAGFACLESVTLPAPTLPTLPIYGGSGETLSLSLSALPRVTLLKGEQEKIAVRVQLPPFVWAPLEAGQTVGRVIYTLNGAQLASAEIIAAETAEEATPLSWTARTRRLFWLLLKEMLT